MMSSDTASNMGFLSGGNHSAGCIGESSLGFRDCVVMAHNDRKYWNQLREEGMTFIKETHQKSQLRNLWNESIREGIRRLRRRQECQASCDHLPGMFFKAPMTKRCLALETSYLERYSTVRVLVQNKTYLSGIDHFLLSSGKEGYVLDLENEKLYLSNHPEVEDGVRKGAFASGWDHFRSIGATEGKVYSAKDENQYRKTYHDIDEAIKNGVLKIGWIHFDLWGGKEEPRRYGCF